MAARLAHSASLSFFPVAAGLKTNIYGDGFNLYYGAVRNTPYKWLNIALLCTRILPSITINRIRYFTARVSNRPDDLTQSQRQDVYLRALRTLPNLTVHFGLFLSNPVSARLVSPPNGGPYTARVIKTEEKGSDVNLATFLLLDAFDADFEQAVVITNDSDLALPIQGVRDRFQLPVGLLCPYPQATKKLARAAAFVRLIRAGPLSASQFPNRLHDEHGSITKPASW